MEEQQQKKKLLVTDKIFLLGFPLASLDFSGKSVSPKSPRMVKSFCKSWHHELFEGLVKTSETA